MLPTDCLLHSKEHTIALVRQGSTADGRRLRRRPLPSAFAFVEYFLRL